MQEKLIWVDYVGLSQLVVGIAILVYVLVSEQTRKNKKELYGGVLISIALVLMGLITYLQISGVLDLLTIAILMSLTFYTTAILYFVLVRWKLRDM